MGASPAGRPSAAPIPVPGGPARALSMMTAKPAPPVYCRMLRKSRIRRGAAATSSTERPVVVQPLVDSKSAWVKFSSSSIQNGTAPATRAVSQAITMIVAPSA